MNTSQSSEEPFIYSTVASGASEQQGENSAFPQSSFIRTGTNSFDLSMFTDVFSPTISRLSANSEGIYYYEPDADGDPVYMIMPDTHSEEEVMDYELPYEYHAPWLSREPKICPEEFDDPNTLYEAVNHWPGVKCEDVDYVEPQVETVSKLGEKSEKLYRKALEVKANLMSSIDWSVGPIKATDERKRLKNYSLRKGKLISEKHKKPTVSVTVKKVNLVPNTKKCGRRSFAKIDQVRKKTKLVSKNVSEETISVLKETLGKKKQPNSLFQMMSEGDHSSLLEMEKTYLRIDEEMGLTEEKQIGGKLRKKSKKNKKLFTDQSIPAALPNDPMQDIYRFD